MDHQSIHSVYLCLGTNLGDKQKNLGTASDLISNSCGNIVKCSGIYLSSPWGYDSSNEFYNQCLKLETELAPEELLEKVLEIELVMGRERKGMKYSDRIIDIDILFYDSSAYVSGRLVIPHPRMAERLFVLKPMMELDPELKHPVLQETLKVLLEKCTDDPGVRRL